MSCQSTPVLHLSYCYVSVLINATCQCPSMPHTSAH
ncbi:unnamed protein product, partial [Staurois parvus]